MSDIVYHQPPRRLAEALRRPGGLKVSEAVARAEQGLAFMQDACLESIDTAIARITALRPRLDQPATARAALTELYMAADEIVGLAGPAQLEALGQAAYSLCALVDRFNAAGRLPPAALKVHLDAFALLRRPSFAAGAPAAAAAVLSGLKQVVRVV